MTTAATLPPDARMRVAAAPAQPVSGAGAWRLPLGTAAWWAAAVALAMSTQYLLQPFVWRYWSVAEVAAGWLEVAADRIAIALSIAAALVLATRLPIRSLAGRTGAIAGAVVAGATAGEMILLAIGVPGTERDLARVARAVVQWTGLSLCIAGIYYLWAGSNEARARVLGDELARSTAESLRIASELQTLRQQIDPHFLFNTLATIRRLKETEARDGAPLLAHLVEYLRSTEASNRGTTLGSEIDLVRSYLAIVAIRMSGRLRYEVDAAADLRACACPPLALATLVENAVKHGVAPSEHGGTIVVRARRDGAALELSVADTGVGMAAGGDFGGRGIGLANIRARRRALYGSRASLVLRANPPHGVYASIRLPLPEARR